MSHNIHGALAGNEDFPGHDPLPEGRSLSLLQHPRDAQVIVTLPFMARSPRTALSIAPVEMQIESPCTGWQGGGRQRVGRAHHPSALMGRWVTLVLNGKGGEAAVERFRPDLENEWHRGGGRDSLTSRKFPASAAGGGGEEDAGTAEDTGLSLGKGANDEQTAGLLLPAGGEKLSENWGHRHVYPANSMSVLSPDGQPASSSGT